MPDDDEQPDDGLELCENCLGRFDRSDMEGEHCRECHAIIFEED